MTETATDRLARYVRHRRERELGLTRDQVRERTLARDPRGVSLTTLRAIELGQRTAYSDRAMRLLGYALKWSDDSLEAIMQGAEPTEVADDEAGSGRAEIDGVGADEWEVTLNVRGHRKYSAAERELIDARAKIAVERTLRELDET